jgi:hypothetical protein
MDRDTGSDLPAPPNVATTGSSDAPVQLRYVGKVALITLKRPEAGNSTPSGDTFAHSPNICMKRLPRFSICGFPGSRP